jgi:hypothetical protein
MHPAHRAGAPSPPCHDAQRLLRPGLLAGLPGRRFERTAEPHREHYAFDQQGWTERLFVVAGALAR